MILYRYIIKEHILPFCYSLAIIVFIFMMQLAVQLLQRILYKGVPIAVIIELFLINSAWMLVLAVPMAVLVSNLMAFGKMSADNEILAIKASGQNLLYLFTPIILVTSLLSVGLVFFHNLVLPNANHRSSSLMSDISRKKPAAMIEPNVLIRDFENYAMIVEDVDSRTGQLTNIRIFSDQPDEDPAVTIANKGLILLTKDEEYLQLTLYNGVTHSTNRNRKDEYYVATFKEQTIFIPNVDSRLKRTNRSHRGDREKSAQDLLSDVKNFSQRKKDHKTSFKKTFLTYQNMALKYDSLAKISDSILIDTTLDSIATFEQWVALFGKERAGATRNIQRKIRSTKRSMQQIKREEKRIAKYMVEVHKKYSTAAACIVFILIGIPLGIMARKGGVGVAVSYSMVFFVMFWVFLIAGENFADRMLVSPEIAMWSANMIIGAIGIFLTLCMIRERSVINYQPIKDFGRRCTKFLYREKTIKTHARSAIRRILHIPVYISNRIIGILPSYLLMSFIKILIQILFLLVIIFVIIDIVSNIRQFTNASFKDIMFYYYYYLAWFIGIILPIGALLASMFSMGGLAKNSELTAIKASGLSVRRLTIAMLFLGIALSGFNFMLVEKFLPDANIKRMELISQWKQAKKHTTQKIIAQKLQRNFYYFGGNQIAYHFDEFRANPHESKNVRRITFSDSTIIEDVRAEKMNYTQNGTWEFCNGSILQFSEDGMKTILFDTLQDIVLKKNPKEMIARIKHITEMSYWELKKLLNEGEKRGEKVDRYLADLHFKLALPFMSFIVIVFGISITARSNKKGSAVNFGVGIGLVFLYWILSQFFLALGKNGTLDPMYSAWAGNGIFLVLGIFLYWRANR